MRQAPPPLPGGGGVLFVTKLTFFIPDNVDPENVQKFEDRCRRRRCLLSPENANSKAGPTAMSSTFQSSETEERRENSLFFSFSFFVLTLI